MKSKGIIRKINEKAIDVEVYKDTECANCSKCNSKSCSIETFNLPHTDNLSVGDIIEFEINNKDILLHSGFVYGSPIAFMFTGYFIASLFNKNENLKILSCFGGLFFSFILIYIFDKIKGKKLINNINITKEIY